MSGGRSNRDAGAGRPLSGPGVWAVLPYAWPAPGCGRYGPGDFCARLAQPVTLGFDAGLFTVVVGDCRQPVPQPVGSADAQTTQHTAGGTVARSPAGR